jgi:predicted secreted acid phosphatase
MPTVLSRRATLAALVATATAVSLGIAGPADARSDHNPGPPLEPRTHFTMAPDGSSGLTEDGSHIPNIDSVKSTVRKYYNATGGIADKETSPYISEMHAIESSTLASLPAVDPSLHKAIVFDADDTTLWTYDMEDGAMHFNFTPAVQDPWVFEGKFPATPGMVDFVAAVQAKGYAIFGITGRRAVQEDATVANLVKVGYTAFDNDNFYTKWNEPQATNKPSYVTCVTVCTTVEYKAGTRKHIEQDLGYDIVLNVGDQWSDLQGGYADQALKLPNPTYYLPSPDLPGLSEPDLAPRTEFRMLPDGSSGLTEGGEGIANIDSVKSTIRTYYHASGAGTADRSSSPYISELADIEAANTDRLVNECRREVRKGGNPAVVFDADDTTLWTYDMEDGAMHFNFDPVLQNMWVQNGLFPATPGMPALVNAVGDAGCTVFGLTGRNDAQKDATLQNLANVGYRAFTADHYFTKWVSGAQPPAYVDCLADGNPSCSTIEYKSSTRAHIEDLGYDIVANFGDQFSDLIGGYADRAVKLPNPTYYLP